MWRLLPIAVLAIGAHAATITHGDDIAVIEHETQPHAGDPAWECGLLPCLQVNTIPYNVGGGRITFHFGGLQDWFRFGWADSETDRDAFIVEVAGGQLGVLNPLGRGIFEWSGGPVSSFTIWDFEGDGFLMWGLEWGLNQLIIDEIPDDPDGPGGPDGPDDPPFTPQETPEPGTFGLLGAGVLALWARRRFSKR